jgi:hypothetical protein
MYILINLTRELKMAKVIDTYTAKMNHEYACAIANGDASALSEHESEELEAWELHWAEMGVPAYTFGDEKEFARDCITKLMGDCIDVTITIFERN